jgi:hypothetical protein
MAADAEHHLFVSPSERTRDIVVHADSVAGFILLSCCQFSKRSRAGHATARCRRHGNEARVSRALTLHSCKRPRCPARAPSNKRSRCFGRLFHLVVRHTQERTHGCGRSLRVLVVSASRGRSGHRAGISEGTPRLCLAGFRTRTRRWLPASPTALKRQHDALPNGCGRPLAGRVPTPHASGLSRRFSPRQGDASAARERVPGRAGEWHARYQIRLKIRA